jgi:hypothetical protein
MRKGCFFLLLVFLVVAVWMSSQLAGMPVPRLSADLVAARSDASYTLVGAPTITADFMNQVLASYHSPAAGTGQALYDLGVHFGIDPVYALAFFQHEDSFGETGWGAVNHSLGNSRCYGWSVCQGGYRYYATWEDGYQDWYNLILNGYVRGQVTKWIVGHVCTTVDEIVPVYAPSSDHNNVAGYTAAIKHAVDGWRQGKIWA